MSRRRWRSPAKSAGVWGPPAAGPMSKEETMAVRITRRNFLAGTAAAALMPVPAFAQQKPVKIGLLTVKTGPLAAGGIQMEQGTLCFLKDKNYTLAGRKVELVVADTGGNPAGARTTTQELVERAGGG